MKKAPQAKIFVIGTIFKPKIAQKCKKWPTENSPPGWGGERKLQKITENLPPHRGDLPPTEQNYIFSTS